ncbi:MAG TPA: DUF3943 domain-containing protein [Bacteroidia bacterium]|nr:DUF3943 domain-containing protein [Bacteroidia bacterium]
MKTVSALVVLLLTSAFLYAQQIAPQDITKVAPSDTIVPAKGKPEEQLKEIKEEKVKQLSDSTGNEPKKSALVDTTVQNKYGDLLDDDTTYNKKYPLWIPLLETACANVFIWSLGRYYLNADYARVGTESWRYNIENGWEWDVDRFGMNFIGHPYSGTLSFNAGRANGYNFIQSATFAVGGSLMWEYFCENTQPSYNDIINTPINGAFLGEILYRLSSNILDDRTRGIQRVSRELLAGLINPMRGLNRILQGKTFRRTNKEVYEKEPLNVSLYAGVHKINDERKPVIGEGTNSVMLNIQFDYGNPFEKRARKPFDFFKLRTEFDFGVGRKILSNVTGYGILLGKNVAYGKHSLLFGLFQYSDYWDNKSFELGAIAFGGGVFSKIPISKTSELYTNIHLGVIPFAGNSTRFGPDTSQVRDYNFGDGLEAKFETTLNLGKYATASMVFYYYMIRTYVGPPGDNFIGIMKPRITVRLYKGISVGFEHFVYYNDRYLQDYPAIHLVRTEQKIFLLLYIEDKQRRGHYN